MKTVFTKNKLNEIIEIRIDENPDYQKYGFNKKWKYYRMEAFIKNETVGTLSIAYVDKEKYNNFFSDEIAYLKSILYNRLPINNKKEINRENIREVLRIISDNHYSNEVPDDIIDKKLKEIIKRTKDKYQNFIDYHYMKPEINMVEVKQEYDYDVEEYKEFRNKGIGFAMYQVAINFLKENNLPLYSSNTQTVEAEFMWKKLKREYDGNLGSDGGKRFIINPNLIPKPKKNIKKSMSI